MPDYDLKSSLGGAAPANRSMTRIDALTDGVKSYTNRVRNTTQRIVQHAQSLGFYMPPPSQTTTATPSPVITTLEDALRELDRALDELNGSLNLFD